MNQKLMEVSDKLFSSPSPSPSPRKEVDRLQNQSYRRGLVL